MDAADSDNGRPARTRPKITLQIPSYTNRPDLQPSPYFQSAPIMTGGIPMPGTAAPNSMGPNGFQYANYMYPQKAGEFMFKQFAGFKDFTMNTAKSGLGFGEKYAFWMYNKVSLWSKSTFTHIFLTIVVLLYSVAGAFIFKAIEGGAEQEARIDIERSRTNLTEAIFNFTLTNDTRQLLNYEKELQTWLSKVKEMVIHHDDYVRPYLRNGFSDQEPEKWSFWNAMFFCGTVYTTIGYGHIAPITTTGKALTIVYAIIGVPLFLIILADFGKLLTRIIKFLWAYVRRLYYTGSCRKVRKQAQVQEMMRGINVMYDMVRRPSQMVTTLGVMQTVPGGPHNSPPHASPVPTPISGASTLSRPTCDSPTLPDIEIDDEFNLPISLALIILIIYMVVGAIVYNIWEEWGFFNAFYFVFISMSTIGFGDYVPNHPMYMMCSIIYLIFGLALTSMCINVVQIKLSDTFRMASAKLGATIGLQQGGIDTASVMEHTPVELASVHVGQKDEDGSTRDIEEVPPLLAKGETQAEPGRPPKSKFDFSSDDKGKSKSKKKDGKK